MRRLRCARALLPGVLLGVLLGLPALSGPPAQSAPLTETRDLDGTLPSGALWRARVPPHWNGTLLLYSHGYWPEVRTPSLAPPDLEDWLLARPRRTVLDPVCRWGIWYPLRRAGTFARLTPQEQGAILKEHGTLGRAYGDAGLAHDVRLACHGLDTHDNDFVIGLVGRELHPLSHLVQAMRRTAQTSQYLASLGPFFVGHVLWQSPSR